ncbi:hypothetical protein BKN38_06615 [Helicobacter sp. CLO-3]|uniref:dihydroorotase n=1 Tax=unclassified Helicobacter TaxID=2593540 RepID=UPI000805000A|nr:MULTISPECIES: dihydroorotase [unclassified Helicobacter]OBV30042.1 hypothetical protein BA723_02845 [Helicobacter sp. CLO-3]OHU82723.1 hypothetical protein BKN38_06615 [Helicobacter sp. CLO-3]
MQITLKNPLDMHLHLRDGAMLRAVAPYSAQGFISAVVMPNLTPPVASLESALSYKRRIQKALESYKVDSDKIDSGAESSRFFIARHFDMRFDPLCALYITDSLSGAELERCAEQGFRLLKLYPKGATTNSDQGVQEIMSKHTREIFAIAERLGMIVCVHGESGGFMMEREHKFGEVFKRIASAYPRLKIIIEHMSDRRTIPLLEDYENLYATLTLHHISLDLDSVVGGHLCAHHFCKPTLKTPADTQALLELALSAHHKVCFGSDSAPHTLESKLQKGAAGIFSAPLLLPQLAELFDKHGALASLQAFVSDNAMKNYDLLSWHKEAQSWEVSPKLITLEKAATQMPSEINYSEAEARFLDSSVANAGVLDSGNLDSGAKHKDLQTLIPLRAGETISWRYKSCR